MRVIGEDRAKVVKSTFTFASNTAWLSSSPSSLTEIEELDILPSILEGA
jgi:hypothetical protein